MKNLLFVFAVLALVSFVAMAQEQPAQDMGVMTSSEVVGDFTVETFPSMGKTAVIVYRMITLPDGKIVKSPGYYYFTTAVVEYQYSTEKKGYPVKAYAYLAPAYQHVEIIGGYEFLKKLPWGPALKSGQAVWEATLDYGREHLYAAGFANVPEAVAFGKKFVAYVTADREY